MVEFLKFPCDEYGSNDFDHSNELKERIKTNPEMKLFLVSFSKSKE
jgi:glutathione peroxidase-family protein